MAAAIVFVGAIGWFDLKKYKDAHTTDTKQATDGSINRGVYTNDLIHRPGFSFTG